MTSYTDSEGRELLFTSGSSAFDGVKPIRGGIPLVFPIFGDGWGDGAPALPGHGFARRSTWRLGPVDGDRVTFELGPDDLAEAHRAAWPHRFALEYAVELHAAGFSSELRVRNAGAEPFSFQALLHTYYSVPAIAEVRVHGLGGRRYLDKLAAEAGLQPEQAGDGVQIAAETDRIYHSVPAEPITVHGTAGAGRAAITVTASDGVPDCVVWNPWVDKAARMGDFGDDEWRSMICVEPGCACAAPTHTPPPHPPPPPPQLRAGATHPRSGRPVVPGPARAAGSPILAAVDAIEALPFACV